MRSIKVTEINSAGNTLVDPYIEVGTESGEELRIAFDPKHTSLLVAALAISGNRMLQRLNTERGAGNFPVRIPASSASVGGRKGVPDKFHLQINLAQGPAISFELPRSQIPHIIEALEATERLFRNSARTHLN